MKRASVILVIAGLCGAARASDWTDKVEFSGYLQSDLRYVIEDYRGPRPGEGFRFEMNRNDLNLRLKIHPDPSAQAVVDARFRFYGFNESATLPELVRRTRVDPYDFQLNEAYLAVRGHPFDAMDFRVGRLIESWGTADMFNPTDNLNARDFSDPLDYTAKVPNQMIEVSVYPTDWLTLTGVFVPVFKPSLLPPSASLGFAVETTRDGCFLRAPTPPLSRADIHRLQGLFAMADPCRLSFAPEVRTVTPPLNLRNSQAAVRAKVQADLGEHGGALDLSFSYFYGRFTFPVAYTAVANLVPSSQNPDVTEVRYTAQMIYPRMHVAGADFAYSPPVDWLPGLFGEVALIFPEQVTFGLAVLKNGVLQPSLLFSGVNVPRTPFVKATVGVDYTFTSWLYMNVQYVRGFFDEFNDRYGLHNYLAPAVELKFFEDEWKIRLAGAWNLDDLSAAVFPELTVVVVPSIELTGGVWAYLGDTKPLDPQSYAGRSKFGQKATGRSVAYLKARVTW